jgi:hypothetical protein
MKQYPPHSSHAGVGPVALLVLTVAMFLVVVLSVADGHGEGGPLDRPLEAPSGLDL